MYRMFLILALCCTILGSPPPAAAMSDSDLVSHLIKASTYLAEDKYQDAVREAGIAIRAASEQKASDELAMALGLRAAALGQSGELQDALADADRAVMLDPTNGFLLLTRGQVNSYLERNDAAVADFTRALAVRDEAPSSGMNAEAAAFLQTLNAAVEALAHEGRSEAYLQNQQYTLGIRDLDWLLDQNERNEVALNNRCLARAMIDRIADALEDCDKAVGLKPDNAEILDTRALVKLKAGRFDGAIRDYEAALRLNPNSASVLYGLGLARVRQNTGSMITNMRGIGEMEKARQIDPNVREQFVRWGLRQ